VSAGVTWQAAYALFVDGVAARAIELLEEAGIECVLLKGSTLHEIYEPGAVRFYGDADLLVPAADWDRAVQTFVDAGFRESWEDVDHPRIGTVTSLGLSRGNEEVDLHSTLTGIELPAEEVWAVLRVATEPGEVARKRVRVLSGGGRALHLALHAAQHTGGRPVEELTMGLERLDPSAWEDAAALARRLRATGAFAAALRLVPEGAALLDALQLADERSAKAELRLDGTPLVEGIDELLTTPGLRAKARLAWREVAVTPDFMRWWSPLARRGPAGLAAAYVARPLILLARVPAALTARRRIRRATESS
jgi:hypothetical protein